MPMQHILKRGNSNRQEWKQTGELGEAWYPKLLPLKKKKKNFGLLITLQYL